jgi:hypothetical protein
MKTAMIHQPLQGGSLGRSIGAIVAGAAVAIVLTVATDLGMQVAGLLPAFGEPASGRMLLLATAYRSLYGVIAGYVVARLAPHHPMRHALIGGVAGLIVSIIGAAATWNRGLGPHWYPVALIALAIPQAWFGGRLRVVQQGGRG